MVGTDDTAYWGWGMQDTTNQYVAKGVAGGLLTLVLFILLLQSAFSRLRRGRGTIEHFEGPKSFWAQLTWGFSVSLAAHCVSFVSVSYFGQIRAFFFMFLALIPALSRSRRQIGQVASHRPSQAAVAAHAAGGLPTRSP